MIRRTLLGDTFQPPDGLEKLGKVERQALPAGRVIAAVHCHRRLER